jgi:YVTN family beta-propeller protein
VSLSADTWAFASCHKKYSSVSVYLSYMKKITFVSRCFTAPILATGMLAAMVLPSSQVSAFTLTALFGTAPYFPEGMVSAATGKQTLYVAANNAAGDSYLLTINTVFGTITAAVPLTNLITHTADLHATQVAINPAGTLVFVVNSGTSTVDIVDAATNAEIKTLRAPQIGPLPIGVRVSPNGKELWVASAANNPPFLNNGTVSVIELTDGLYTSLAQINTGGSPNTVVFNSKGSAAYVLNGNVQGFVDEVNVRKFTVIRGKIGEPDLNNPNVLSMDITKDNSTLYIGNFQSYVNNVDIPTGGVDNSIFMFPGIGSGFQAIGQVAVSPDQKYVVCADPALEATSVAKTKTQAFDTFLFTFFGGSEPYFLTFSDDSKTLYVSEAFGVVGNQYIDVWTGF